MHQRAQESPRVEVHKGGNGVPKDDKLVDRGATTGGHRRPPVLPGHPCSRPLHMVFPSSRHPLLHSHCRSSSPTSPPPFFHIHRSLTHPFLSRSRRTGEPNKPSLARYGAPRSLLFDFFAFPRYAGCGKYRVSISVSGVWCIARFSPGSGSTPPTLPV